jgi:lysophospholipase L1-like esterase
MKTGVIGPGPNVTSREGKATWIDARGAVSIPPVGTGPARLAAVALACLVPACAGHDGPGSTTPPTPVRWIAAGDSYSSGEGAPGSVGRCGRTDEAAAPLARVLVADDVALESFEHAACTGAVIDDVLDQLRNARGPDEPRFNLVTLTIGGNDIGFSKVLVDCIGGDDLFDLATPGGTGCDLSEDELLGRTVALTDRLVELYEQIIDELSPGGALVVLGYPNLTVDPSRWQRRLCQGIGSEDAALLRRVATALDEHVAEAVARVDAVYVPLIDTFDGHELCASRDEWINGLTLGIGNRTLRLTSAFHPNAAGQEAAAEVLAGVLLDLYDAG